MSPLPHTALVVRAGFQLPTPCRRSEVLVTSLQAAPTSSGHLIALSQHQAADPIRVTLRDGIDVSGYSGLRNPWLCAMGTRSSLHGGPGPQVTTDKRTQLSVFGRDPALAREARISR